MMRSLTLAALALLPLGAADAPRQVSGIYPHLAYYNGSGECGTGAVVPWADRLWVITYAPHCPNGSDDKLYEITPDLQLIVRPESVGGTPANRMIHPESQQLFIGPYAIGAERQVRVLTPQAMPGRHTGNARHLSDPANKIYYATMEEGFYEVDVKTLAVTTIHPDANATKDAGGTLLPGYHGKGLYSGQGRLIYANNGERSPQAQKDPRTPSGVLAEWDGKDWTVIRRNQFTEVTGPGGITGNANPATDPIWSTGWDDRSLMLYLRDATSGWQVFRLPKASHCYDGAHGWNTEWPRIRDIGVPGNPELLMTMHGMFWSFPIGFSAGKTAGIRPKSSYLKVIGDFCRWGDRIVLGCDDSAKSEFLNKRKSKGEIAGPGQSHSNLWFVQPETLGRLGATTASGAVWLNDALTAGQRSEPFLFAGWERRAVHLVNGGAANASFVLEIDAAGDGTWKEFDRITVAAGGATWRPFTSTEAGEWIRVTAVDACAKATVLFSYDDVDQRTTTPDAMFAGLAAIDAPAHHAGLIRARGENLRTMSLAASHVDGVNISDAGYYELDAMLNLVKKDDAKSDEFTRTKVAIPTEVVSVDAASVLITDDRGRRWRLPKGAAAFDAPTVQGKLRLDREVATERDLFNCHGTFYELPAENADGFARIRPVSSHRLRIHDYASYRGLLVMTGVADGASGPHIIRADDGKAAVWVGGIDDLWKLGRVTGVGGPWKDTAVMAGKASDPYLFAGYDARKIALSHGAADAVNVTIELDLTGNGLWVPYKTLAVPAGQQVDHVFPGELQARWLRVTADKAVTASAVLTYE